MTVSRYAAAGGVVVDGDKVLVLLRPSKAEVRLPKGHIDPGETPEQAAVREVGEESGYERLEVLADLGEQTVRFSARWSGAKIERTERYFLIRPSDGQTGYGEWEFEPAWVSWEEAEERLSYEVEREWLRRARAAMNARA